MYNYTISIIGEDSISSLYMAYQSLLSIGLVKNKKKRYIYIHCCELTVPAVTWVIACDTGGRDDCYVGHMPTRSL